MEGSVPFEAAPIVLANVNCADRSLLSVSGCSGGVLDPQGPVGAANAKIMLNALGIMLVIVVPTLQCLPSRGGFGPPTPGHATSPDSSIPVVSRSSSGRFLSSSSCS